jgi:hypothetical protein
MYLLEHIPLHLCVCRLWAGGEVGVQSGVGALKRDGGRCRQLQTGYRHYSILCMCVYVCMHVCMEGWMYGGRVGCMYVCMYVYYIQRLNIYVYYIYMYIIYYINIIYHIYVYWCGGTDNK